MTDSNLQSRGVLPVRCVLVLLAVRHLSRHMIQDDHYPWILRCCYLYVLPRRLFRCQPLHPDPRMFVVIVINVPRSGVLSVVRVFVVALLLGIALSVIAVSIFMAQQDIR